MKSVQFSFGKQLSRRAFLRGSGVALTLPWLSAMSRACAATPAVEAPRRFVSISLGLGLHSENLFPTGAGRDYEPSLYLRNLQDVRNDFTVVSGVSHPGVGGGHRAEGVILTAAPGNTAGGFTNTISLDQLMAKHLGGATRYPSLVLNSNNTSSPSYTENGSMIPAETSPGRLYTKLFVDDTPAEQQRQLHRVAQGRSIMDLVGEDSRALQRTLGTGDRDRLDAYFTSVRELEHRLAASEDWIRRPKPKVDEPQPQEVANPNDLIARERAMMGVMRLALQTDSTRFITLHMGGEGGVVPVEGVDQGYHNLSHHGMDDEKLRQLALVEEAIVQEWGEFIRQLKSMNESQGTILDRTMVLLTSNLGNASSHDNKNMPVLFAGGGFRHGQHLAFDRKNNYALPKLYVSALQQIGLPLDRFAETTGTMDGLAPQV